MKKNSHLDLAFHQCHASEGKAFWKTKTSSEWQTLPGYRWRRPGWIVPNCFQMLRLASVPAPDICMRDKEHNQFTKKDFPPQNLWGWLHFNNRCIWKLISFFASICIWGARHPFLPFPQSWMLALTTITVSSLFSASGDPLLVTIRQGISQPSWNKVICLLSLARALWFLIHYLTWNASQIHNLAFLPHLHHVDHATH